MMQAATLEIQSAPGGLRFAWTGPDGTVRTGVRSVHPDDLARASHALDTAPESLGALEDLGRRIYSRLLERGIREAVFSAPPCLLTLHTDVPEVPWEAAFGEGRFLADAHAVGRGPKGPMPARRGDLRVLMIVNPTGDLPYSESEAAQVAERLRNVGRVGIRTLVGAAATRDAILTALETDAFDAIHVSCHAAHDPACPARSHIRCYDAPLTAEDLYQAATVRPPALCVLNACESGRAGGAEPPSGAAAVEGLAGALRGAGAAAVLGALWPVSNKSAAHAMSVLYAAIASGDALGEAVRMARAQTRRLFAHDPMLTWAAYTLSGAPGVRLLTPDVRVRLGSAPLVGRDRERAVLDRAWSDARSGRGNGVLLLGAAGTGKSRLLDEWLASVPGAPVVTLAGEEPGDALARAGVTHGADPSQAAEATADWARAHGGGIVACDGLEGATDAGRAYLAAAARMGVDAPLLILATARTPDAVAILPGTSLQYLAIEPLRREDLSALFGALGADLPDGLQAAAPAEAERLALGRPATETPGVLAAALPELERSVLRAAAVVGDPFTVDDATALLERPKRDLWRPLDRLCTDGWLVEAAPGVFRFRNGADRAPVLESFRPMAERAEMHRRQAQRCAEARRPGEAGCHWSAAGDEAAARESFLAAVRSAVEAGDPHSVLLWHGHLAEVNRTPDGAGYAAKVAAASGETGDWAGARLWWERALEREPEPSVRAERMVYLAEAAARCGDLKAAEHHLVAAERLTGRESVAAMVLWAEILLDKGLPDGAVTKARAGRDAARAEGDASLAARAALAEANAFLMAADPDGAARACIAGLAAPDIASAQRTALVRALARARRYAGDYDAAEAALTGLRDEQRDAHQPDERAATLLALGELWRDQGRLEPATEAVEEAQRLGDRCGQPSVVAEAETLRGTILRRQGRYGAALEAAARAGETARRAHLAPAAIHATILSATVLAEQGRLAAARDASEEAAASAEAAGYRFGLAWARTILGTVDLERGDPTAARGALEEALETSRAISGHIGIANALHYLGWAAWDEGFPDPAPFEEAEQAAARISYRATQYPAAFGAALCRGDAEAADGRLREIEALNMGSLAAWLRARRGRWHMEAGRTDAAARDLTSAYRVARRLGMRAVQARAAAALADLYDATGEPMANDLRAEAEHLWCECVA